MDENSWLFDVLDFKIIREIGPKKLVDLSLDFVRDKFRDENQKKLLKCALCPNMCEFSCPVLIVEGKETVSPARKSKLGYLYSKNKLEAEELGKSLYYCVSCDACENNCPMDLNVSDLLIPIRKDLNEKGVVPSKVLEIRNNLVENKIIYDDIEHEATDNEKIGEGTTIYFRSCVARKEAPELAEATFNLIKELDGDVQTLEEEICCGSPALSLGFGEEFSKIGEKLAKKLNESKADRVICSCPSCAKTLKETYPENGLEVKPEILHISEYLAENVSEDLELDESLKVTYHDPCTLARDLDLVDEPREVLRGIKNLDLEEAHFSMEDTRCCGRGGSVRHVDEELTGEIAEDRVNHLKDWANTVITSCPSCKVALNEESGIEAVSLAEVVSKAIE